MVTYYELWILKAEYVRFEIENLIHKQRKGHSGLCVVCIMFVLSSQVSFFYKAVRAFFKSCSCVGELHLSFEQETDDILTLNFDC